MSNDVHSVTMPKVIIHDEVYQKIMYYVHKSKVEISGLGMVEKRADGFHIIDTILLPQKNGATSTDIEPADVCKAMYELRNSPGTLQFWWHSHVNMDVFWSGTDRTTMTALAEAGWFISTVFNKKDEMRTAFNLGLPFAIMIDNVETEVLRVLDAEKVTAWDAEYEKNVSVYTPKVGNFSKKKYYQSEDVSRFNQLPAELNRVDPDWNMWVNGSKNTAERISPLDAQKLREMMSSETFTDLDEIEELALKKTLSVSERDIQNILRREEELQANLDGLGELWLDSFNDFDKQENITKLEESIVTELDDIDTKLTQWIEAGFLTESERSPTIRKNNGTH